tara:strand:+ start:450 stop:812 length:363 start_codon:yes stop_codon:yes gene_type:complete
MSEPVVVVAPEEGQLQDYSVDQLAGAVVLVLGAIAGLLQVIWMSKCHCKVNLCYIFRCERRPPTEEEMKTLQDKAKDLKNKQQQKKEDKKKDNAQTPRTPRTDIESQEPEPEPEPTADLM